MTIKNIPCILKVMRKEKISKGGKLKVVLALKRMNSIYIAAILGGIGAFLAISKKNEEKENNDKKDK